MPDITLSPIPYGGGTLSMTTANSHMCQVSGNRFFAMFGQATPNMTFAATIDVSNIKAAAPTYSIVKQRAMSATALTRVRTWKLNATTVLALVNANLVVYKIQPDGDIVAGASSSSFHSTQLWGTEGASLFGIGTLLYGHHIKDNNVWFLQRASTTAPITLIKVVYDPVGETLSITTVLTLQASTVATNVWQMSIQQVPNSTNWIVSALNITTVTVPAFHILDDSGNVVRSETSGIPASARVLVPFSTTKIASLATMTQFRLFNGSVWSATAAQFAGAAVAGTIVVQAEALDDVYAMVLSTTSGTEIGASVYSLRVFRILDADFGQTSINMNTTNTNGIAYVNPYIYFDQKILQKSDTVDSIYFMVGRASATTFRIRILYQQPV